MPIDLIWLETHLPGLPAILAGYILIGQEPGSCRTVVVSLHKDWSFIPSDKDREVLAGMEDYLRLLLEEDLERGLSALEEASNVIRFSERLRLVGEAVDAPTLSQQLDRLLLTGTRGKSSFSATA